VTIKEKPDDGIEMPTQAEAIEEIECLQSSLQNIDGAGHSSDKRDQ
jgi:hypothetical protein